MREGMREGTREGMREEMREGVREGTREGMREGVREGMREGMWEKMRKMVGMRGCSQPTRTRRSGGGDSKRCNERRATRPGHRSKMILAVYSSNNTL